MSELKEQIEFELEKIRNKYLASADEINSDYNRENDVADDYKGRQIFELLQNAEDEAAEGQGKVLIDFFDNKFSISNTGNSFSFKGVKSLLRAYSSPKKIRKNTIGNKGLGFRSVLNWANKISVITKDFALEFSKENAIEYLKALYNEKPQLKKELKGLNPDEFPIAILACPKFIKKTPRFDYTTTIEIECKENCLEEVSKQIDYLDLNELLFLKGLKDVTIATNEKNRTFSKIPENGFFSIIEYDNLVKQEISKSKWQLFSKKGSIKYQDEKKHKEISKDYELIIAYDSTNKTSCDYLYSYFKTKEPLSFPGIIHGTFDLTTDRNSLKPGNEINSQLVEILADFVIETAVQISVQNKECNYDPLKLVLTQEKPGALLDYNYYHILKERIKEKKIFPSISGKYLSLKDFPKYSDKRYDKILSPVTFFDLLQHCEDENIKAFLNENISFYDNEDFTTRLNKDVSNEVYTIDDKCSLMKILRFENNISQENLNLLVDTENKNVTNNEKVYIKPSNDQIIHLPKCVKSIRFLNETMQNILLENGTQQTLSDNYKSFGVLPYRFNTLITNVIKALNDNLTEENVNQVLIWLFNYYESNKENDEISREQIQDFNIPVVCRNGIKKATEAYFGKEYENPIGETIISSYSSNFLKNASEIFNTSEIYELISFYEWLGVSKFPRIKSIDIPQSKHSDYMDYCFQIINKIVCWGESFRRNDFHSNSIQKLSLGTIEHFETILLRVSFDDILCWFFTDTSIHNRIKSKTEIDDTSKMDCTPAAKQNNRPINKNQLASYINYLILNTEWIKTNDKKKSPKYCCMEQLVLEPKISVPIVDYDYIKKTCGASKLQVNTLLQEIGITYQFLEFPIDTQYEVLLALPDLDVSKKISKRIYNLVKQLEPEDVKSSNKYKEFLMDGKVLVKYKETKEFISVKEAFYVDKKIFGENLLKDFRIFEIDHRVGNEKVKKIFGVKPLNNLEVEFIKCNLVESNLDTQFFNDYIEFISYVLVSRKQTKNYRTDLSRLKKTSVKLVTELEFKVLLTNSEEMHNLQDYETIYFRKKNAAYIKIPVTEVSLINLKQNINFSDAVSELITTILDVNDEKNFYRELFSGNRQKRDFLIRNDKGDENLEILNSVRQELNFESNKKLDFWSVISDIKKLPVSEEITEDALIQDLGISLDFANSINYDDINDITNAEKIIELFTQLQIEINTYNDMALNSINLIPYWTTKFNIARNSYKEKYMSYVYSICKEKKDIKKFEDLTNLYSLNDPKITNVLDFNISQKSNEIFGISFDELEKIEEFNLSEITKNNKNKYERSLVSQKVDYFGNSKVDLYLLFDCFDNLIIPENKLEDETHTKTQNDINKTAEELTKNIDIEDSEIEKPNIPSVQPKEKGSPKHGGGVHTGEEDITKQTNGRAGELAVYKELIKKYPNLQWLSGNAEYYKHISKGDDTLGYDMFYINKEGQKIYIEVKASSSNKIEFSISRNEMDFALRNQKYYEIYFVFLENGNAHIKRLGPIFHFKNGEDLFNNSKFYIENEKYKITTTILNKIN